MRLLPNSCDRLKRRYISLFDSIALVRSHTYECTHAYTSHIYTQANTQTHAHTSMHSRGRWWCKDSINLLQEFTIQSWSMQCTHAATFWSKAAFRSLTPLPLPDMARHQRSCFSTSAGCNRSRRTTSEGRDAGRLVSSEDF